jgi:hypothetical protein
MAQTPRLALGSRHDEHALGLEIVFLDLVF